MWAESDRWLSSMTPRSRADCTTLMVEDSTGISLMSICWSRWPAPSHMISVLDGLKRSLLADIQLLTSAIQAARQCTADVISHWFRSGCHLHTDESTDYGAPPAEVRRDREWSQPDCWSICPCMCSRAVIESILRQSRRQFFSHSRWRTQGS